VTYAFHLALVLCLHGAPSPAEASAIGREQVSGDAPAVELASADEAPSLEIVGELEQTDEDERRTLAVDREARIVPAVGAGRARAYAGRARSHPDAVHAHAPRGPPAA
jgi:hypothetical protein